MRIYLDSCVVIYAVEGSNPIRTTIRRRLLSTDESPPPAPVFSDLTRLECRVGPKRRKDIMLLEQYDQFFSTPGFLYMGLDNAVFDLATDLRAAHGLKTPDALHLAAALVTGCHEFWTNDTRLAATAGTRLQVVTFGESKGEGNNV